MLVPFPWGESPFLPIRPALILVDNLPDVLGREALSGPVVIAYLRGNGSERTVQVQGDKDATDVENHTFGPTPPLARARVQVRGAFRTPLETIAPWRGQAAELPVLIFGGNA